METVKIKNPAIDGDYIIINKCDYNEKTMELFIEAVVEEVFENKDTKSKSKKVTS